MKKSYQLSMRSFPVVPFMLAIGGCGSSAPTPNAGPSSLSGSTEPLPGAGTSGSPVQTAAEEFVAQNASADTNLHLLARAFVNDRSEVISFYEPTPGRIVLVGAGHPKGPSQLARSGGKTADDWWKSLVPSERMPNALLEAIGRQAAGVGKENLVSLPASAPQSLTTSASRHGSAPTLKVLGSGYCDAQWPNDFPANDIVGDRTDLSGTNGNEKMISGPHWVAPLGHSAIPEGNDCACSDRTVQGFVDMDTPDHDDNGNPSNTWNDYVNVCVAQGNALVTVTASNWNQSFSVGEDFFLWLEDTGTVTCAGPTCLSTNDIGQFSVSADSQLLTGTSFINFLTTFYGP